MTAPRITESTSSTHWPALDGFRGVTIWAAVSVHAGYLTANGVLSLTTFFVLSGFLITGLLIREWERKDRISLGAFWARRARRLLPGLFIVLLAVAVYAALIGDRVGLDRLRLDVVSAVGYFTNWRFIASGQSYFANFSAPSPILHLWSLAVEEQFYLFWPLIVVAVLKFSRGSTRVLAAVAAVGAVASAAWMAVLYQPGGDPSRVYYGTDTRAQAMLVGAVLAVWVHRRGAVRSETSRRLLTGAGAVGFVVLAVPWFLGTSLQRQLYGWSMGELVYSLVTVVVLWSLVQPKSGPLGALLSLRPVRWVGDISYEMYLWHWPLYLVLDRQRLGIDGAGLFAVRLSVLVVAAALTHFLVAEPVRRGARLRTPVTARAGAAIAASIAIIGTMLATAGAPPALAGKTGELAGGVSAAEARKQRPPPESTSTQSLSADPIRVLVVGDSQAHVFAQGEEREPGLHGLSAQPGLNVWNRAVIGCAVERSDLYVRGLIGVNTCGNTWVPVWKGDIGSFQPDVVLLWDTGWDVFDRIVDGRVFAQTSREFAKNYRADFDTLLDALQSSGAPLVVVEPACFGLDVATGNEQQPERLDKTRRRVTTGLIRAGARAHKARLYDLASILCPKGESDAILRPDGTHLGNAGADFVAPKVARILKELGVGHRHDQHQADARADPSRRGRRQLAGKQHAPTAVLESRVTP